MLKLRSIYFCKISIFFLWFGAAFDPVGDLFIRYIALFLSMLTILILFFRDQINYGEASLRSMSILLLSIIMPIYGLFIYAVRSGGDEFIDTSYLATALLMMTSILYRDQPTCIFGIRCFLFCSRLLALVIIACFIGQIFSLSDWYWFFVENQIAFIGQRNYSGINLPYVYFVASPLLIFLISYEYESILSGFGKIRYIGFAIATLALFLSGTRFNMLLAIIFVPLYLFLVGRKKQFFNIFIFFIPILFFSYLIFNLQDFFNSIFSISEESNSVKLSYLNNYLNIFQFFDQFVFGQGFNAHEWSFDFREILPLDYKASKTELTYLELIRVYGIVLSFTFFVLLLFIIHQLKNNLRHLTWIYPGLFIFLLSTSLNPYLFSTNGILPLALFLSIIFYFGNSSEKMNIKLHP